MMVTKLENQFNNEIFEDFQEDYTSQKNRLKDFEKKWDPKHFNSMLIEIGFSEEVANIYVLSYEKNTYTPIINQLIRKRLYG